MSKPLDDRPGPHPPRALLAWMLGRHLRARAAQSLLTVLAVALGVTLMLSVPLSAGAFQTSAIAAADLYDLIVTAEGGRTQAVMSTIYYQDAPTGNVPYELYASLRDDPRTERAIPIALGDNVEGFPVVGTTPAYFDLRPRATAPAYFQLATGRLFEHRFEAVLGAQVARTIGMGPGDTFLAEHGLMPELEAVAHHHVYRVVGVLEATGGPADRAVFTSVESVWDVHGLLVSDDGALDAEHPCAHLIAGPASAIDADGQALLEGEHIRFDMSLTRDGDTYAGRVRYRVDGDEPLLLLFDAAVEVDVLDEDGERRPVRRFEADDLEGCLPAVLAVVVEDLVGVVTIELRGAQAPLVRMVVEYLEHHDHDDEDHDDHEDDGEHRGGFVPVEEFGDGGMGGDPREVTAVLYMARQLGDLYRMSRFIEELPGVQAVFPGQVMGQMMDVVGDGRRAFDVIGAVVLVLALVTVALNTYGAALHAQHDLAVLRLVGVPSRTVAAAVVAEAVVLASIGLVVGIVAAHAAAAGFSQWLSAGVGLTPVAPRATWSELAPTLWMLPVATLLALLPAWRAARTSPLARL